MTLDDARVQLEAHGQGHVLRFYDQLDSAKQKLLLETISEIDLDWLDGAVKSQLATNDPSEVLPYRAVIRADDARAVRARAVGNEALQKGTIGVLLVAGGAGTRLGFEGPKGIFPIGPISQKSLFALHVERLVAVGRRYGSVPPLYLMTSPENHDATCQFFAEHANFGLPSDRLLIFPQGMAPAVDSMGKLLLADKHQLVMAPNGNGGLFAAMRDGGAFAHMHASGIEAISYIQVDNALADATDPLFLGFHLLDRCDFSCKAIPKVGPQEKVGNFALAKGRLAIVEYYEIPDELAEKRDDSGELLFNWGNPGLFAWSTVFAEKQANRRDLPVHKAHKKIPYVNAAGDAVTPESPNGYKLETFALDTLLDAQKALVLACERDAEFAPVKNATGIDSPASARALMSKLYRGWIEKAGGRVADGVTLELSPLYALDAEQLAEKLAPDTTIEVDRLFE